MKYLTFAAVGMILALNSTNVLAQYSPTSICYSVADTAKGFANLRDMGLTEVEQRIAVAEIEIDLLPEIRKLVDDMITSIYRGQYKSIPARDVAFFVHVRCTQVLSR